jgi:hypothetical protein
LVQSGVVNVLKSRTGKLMNTEEKKEAGNTMMNVVGMKVTKVVQTEDELSIEFDGMVKLLLTYPVYVFKRKPS